MTVNHLSAELRRLREQAGLSGRTAAARVGLSQSRLSRIERGAFMPTADEIKLLCVLYRAPATVRDELVRVAKDIHEESSSARVILQRGAWRMQERIGRIEQASGRIRSFAPVIVPGLLQTPAYVKAVFADGSGDDSAPGRAIAARTERQRLLASERQFTFLVSEGALRWNLAGAAAMSEQMEHIEDWLDTENVRVGIVSTATVAPLPAIHGFHLYDTRAVMIGTLTATAIITDPRDIADYERQFMAIEHVASFGASARVVLRRVAKEYRRLAD